MYRTSIRWWVYRLYIIFFNFIEARVPACWSWNTLLLHHARSNYIPCALPLPPCAHVKSAPTCSCITSLDFLVPSPLLKSIINEIKQLRFWRDGTGGFEAMFYRSPRLIGPGKDDVRRPHAPRIGESGVNKAARRRRRVLHISRQSDRHTESDFMHRRGRPRRRVLVSLRQKETVTVPF